MRFLQFIDQIDEAKFRKPREMYHGTTDKFLRTILKQGIIPDPKEKKWEDDPHISQYSLSRASLPGSYWTSNLMTARSSSTNTTGKFGGRPIVVTAQIAELAAYADEDTITSTLQYALPKVYQELFGRGIVADAVPKLMAGIYWNTPDGDAWVKRDMPGAQGEDFSMKRAIRDTYARLVHDELAADPQRQPIPYDLLELIPPEGL